jgi:hypothetical protein
MSGWDKKNSLMANPLSATSLKLILDKKLFPFFAPLLQKGVMLKVQVGCSLSTLLVDQLGLKPEYMKERIKTIFLEGNPVDDLETALVKDGSVLALSAAMPGLAGATLRRGGFFAGMRSPILQREMITPTSPEEGFVVIKLFNLLIRELGPIFLDRGIFFPPNDFGEFLKNLPDEFWRGCKEIKVNGEEKDEVQLRNLSWLTQAGGILLSVQFVP